MKHLVFIWPDYIGCLPDCFTFVLLNRNSGCLDHIFNFHGYGNLQILVGPCNVMLLEQPIWSRKSEAVQGTDFFGTICCMLFSFF